MIENKVTIEGKIVSLGEWHETKKGGRIRDFFVEAEGKRTQYYCLTEVVDKDAEPKILVSEHFYRFEGYVNGLLIPNGDRQLHVNKILLSKIWKPG